MGLEGRNENEAAVECRREGCGHPMTLHTKFWDDDNGLSGDGCSLCRCDNFQEPILGVGGQWF